jgi:maltose alpha-D-glucosyltransferase/alpha-amylase
MVTLHNFASTTETVKLKVGCDRDDVLVEVFDGKHSHLQNDGFHRIRLEPYAWRWFRVGAADNILDRSDLTLMPDMKVR